jgi:Ras-related protein Rab-1A
MSEIDDDDASDEKQINELYKSGEQMPEKNIYEHNDQSKDRPSHTSKNSDLFFQQNNRYTTIVNNFENPEDESEDISKRTSNINKKLTNSNIDNIDNTNNINNDNSNQNKNIINSNQKDSIKNSKEERKTKSVFTNKIDLKIILIGSASVGKTCILGRYIDNKFEENTKCTINVEKKTKLIDVDLNTSVKMNIWDTAGQERYRGLTKQYYHDCHGAVIVFDLTSKETFESLPNWIQELNENAPKTIVLLFLGNKSDLTNERVVTAENIKKFIGNKYMYYEVSAKNGNNISLAFDKLRVQIMEQLKRNQKNEDENDIKYNVDPRNSKDLDNIVNEKSSKCC